MKLGSVCNKVLFTALTLGCAIAGAQERPKSLKFCHEDQDSFPYVFKDKLGSTGQMMKLLEKQIGIPIEMVSMPWKRCLNDMKEGTVDGAFPASFKQDRLEMGQYPMTADGKPDNAKRTHTSGYSLYRLKGSKVDWDGSKIVNATGSIGAQAGFSVGDVLKKSGAQVDDGTKSAEDALKKLIAGRLAGVALQPTNGDNLLEKNAEFHEKIEKAPQPIEEKPYFLMLSFKLTKTYPALGKEIWDKIATIRESAEFKKMEAEFFK